ncbi:MAG: hypothetical protein ACOCYZ_02655 [Halococcoides sp.]
MHRANRAGIVAVLALGALFAVAAGGPAAGQTDATLLFAWDSEQDDRAIVSLSETPEGLGGYTIELAVEESSAARIESIEQVTNLGPLENVTISDDGRQATVKVADTRDLIGPESRDVDLIAVEFADASADAPPPVRITDTEFTTTDGASMPVTVDRSTATRTAETLTSATEAEGPAPGPLAALATVALVAIALTRRP